MSINDTLLNNNLIVWGTTYEIREQIESLGGIRDSKLGVSKLPPLDVEETKKKLNDALNIAKEKTSSAYAILKTCDSPNSVPQSLSIRKAKSIYVKTMPKTTFPPIKIEEKVKIVKNDPPVFLMQSVAEELIEARKLRTSGSSSRRSSYGTTQLGHIVSQEILSPKILENAVINAKDEVRLAKNKLNKFSSIEFASVEHANRRQRNIDSMGNIRISDAIEDACQALLAVEDLYLKQNTLESASLAWYNGIKSNV